jgi:hypothetical protein
LSNLSVNPTAVYQGAGGGTTVVSATFSFADAGGDLTSLGLQIKDGTGATMQSVTTPITGAAGAASGTITGQVSVTTTTVDLFSFRITVTDQQASVSNALTGTFRVAAPPISSQAAMPTPRGRVAAVTLGGLVYTLGGGDAYGNHFTTVVHR